ncbi:MAG: hypothetical protein ACLRMJ_02185 [Alistipes finegoldii]
MKTAKPSPSELAERLFRDEAPAFRQIEWRAASLAYNLLIGV